MELKLERVVIRDWREGDMAALVKHANNRNVWINVRDLFPHPYTLDDARSWIRIANKGPLVTNFAITLDGEAIGGIGLTMRGDVHRRSAEVGYWLGETFWGRGIATEALQGMVDHAFKNHDIVRLDACIFEWNHASVRVLEKCGFQFEGRLRKSITKDGKTIDSLCYALTR